MGSKDSSSSHHRWREAPQRRLGCLVAGQAHAWPWPVAEPERSLWSRSGDSVVSAGQWWVGRQVWGKMGKRPGNTSGQVSVPGPHQGSGLLVCPLSPLLPHRKTQDFEILVSPLFCLLCVLRTAPGLPLPPGDTHCFAPHNYANTWAGSSEPWRRLLLPQEL